MKPSLSRVFPDAKRLLGEISMPKRALPPRSPAASLTALREHYAMLNELIRALERYAKADQQVLNRGKNAPTGTPRARD